MENEIVKIGEGIYQIKYYWMGMADVYAFLIVGKERALLIDTCYSITDTKKYVDSVTDLPVTVVHTHGHFDHIGGAGSFDDVYLSERDKDLVKEHSDYEWLNGLMDNYKRQNPAVAVFLEQEDIRRELDKSLHITLPELKPLPEEGFFELGDRMVFFLSTPGHTPGCICLFDEQSKYFFVGDMACEEGALLGEEHASSVEEYRNSVLLMKKYYESHQGVKIIPSHHQMPAGEDIFDRYLSLCDDILEGKLVGEYVDTGLASGYLAEKENLQLIYRKAREV